LKPFLNDIDYLFKIPKCGLGNIVLSDEKLSYNKMINLEESEVIEF
jgi:hypothetical protein